MYSLSSIILLAGCCKIRAMADLTEHHHIPHRVCKGNFMGLRHISDFLNRPVLSALFTVDRGIAAVPFQQTDNTFNQCRFSYSIPPHNSHDLPTTHVFRNAREILKNRSASRQIHPKRYNQDPELANDAPPYRRSG